MTVNDSVAFYLNKFRVAQSSGRRDMKKWKNSTKLVFKHYRKEGHTIKRCFETVGYPSWYKNKPISKKSLVCSYSKWIMK